MDRCSPGFLLVLSLTMLMVLAGCAGKSSNIPGNDTVQSVSLNPDANNISIDLGSTGLAFSATARNGIGGVVLVTPTFVSSNNAALTIANDGEACAGTWDSLINPVVCKPGVAGVAQVTAVVGGISSPPSTVYVHQHIDNIVVSPTNPPLADCFSLNDPNPQIRTAIYQATAYSNGVDITSTVGPVSFSTTQSNVLTIDSNNQLPMNQVQVTAKDPGITNIFATVGGATSSPVQFTTCLVSSVVLQAQNNQSNSINFSGAGSATLQATVFDTRGNNVSNPPLTWASTNPEVAKFTSVTTSNATNSATIGGNNLGGADLFAACEPPSCNIGIVPGLPIYSVGGLLLNGKPDPHPPNPADKPAFGAIAVNVTNSKIPTFTAWTTTTGCGDALNCASAVFALTTSNSNPITATTALPYTPNSFRITPDGSTAYLGSKLGLMIVTLTSNPSVSTASSQTTPCNVALCGQVLAISPDNKHVVVGDTISSPNQVYIFSTGSAAVDLTIPGATAAAYSPDGLKLFVLTNTGTMYVYSTVDALVAVSGVGNPTDLAFSADGSFAYLAASTPNTVSGFATCNQTSIGTSSALDGNPIRIFPLASTTEVPATTNVNGLAAPISKITQELVTVAPPNAQLMTATYTRNPLPDGQFTCVTPQLSFSVGQAFNFGQGTFTPLYMEVAGSGGSLGAQIVLVANNVPAVLTMDATSGATNAFPLVNGAMPLAASASPDGSQIFVAACDTFQNGSCTAASVHIVNTLSGGDIQQTPYNNPNTHNSMCIGIPNFCVPDLIAVKPQ